MDAKPSIANPPAAGQAAETPKPRMTLAQLLGRAQAQVDADTLESLIAEAREFYVVYRLYGLDGEKPQAVPVPKSVAAEIVDSLRQKWNEGRSVLVYTAAQILFIGA